jgi:hypothetical protein
MSKVKKQPVNSIEAAVQAHQDTKRSIAPPIELDDRELIVFNEIVWARPMSDWNEVELRLAAMTSRQINLIKKLHDEINSDGPIVESSGIPKISPKFGAAEMLGKSVLATLRHLGVSAVQRDKGRANTKLQSQLEMNARLCRDDGYDDLL